MYTYIQSYMYVAKPVASSPAAEARPCCGTARGPGDSRSRVIIVVMILTYIIINSVISTTISIVITIIISVHYYLFINGHYLRQQVEGYNSSNDNNSNSDNRDNTNNLIIIQ